MERDTDKDTERDTDMEFAKDTYAAIVPIAPYGLPMTYQGTSSNSTLNPYRRWDSSLNDALAELEILV
jgi:hypothetical protein